MNTIVHIVLALNLKYVFFFFFFQIKMHVDSVGLAWIVLYIRGFCFALFYSSCKIKEVDIDKNIFSLNDLCTCGG